MIKRLNPKATFRVVSQLDPALDFGATAASEHPAWLKFLENFDMSVLPVKAGETPTVFHIRPLLHSELAEINEEHMLVDTVKKRIEIKNRSAMLLAMFNKAVVGVEENGKVEPITADELPYGAAVSLGSLVSVVTNMERPAKKD